MALPTSGPLSLSDIQTEFGGSNPISLSEYYAGGSFVPAGTTGTYGAVPSSGAISIRNFYGTTAVVIAFEDQSISDIQVIPDSALAGYQINSNGRAYSIESSSFITNELEQWATPTSVANQYEVYATVLSGALQLTFGDVNTWLSLGTTRDWYTERLTSGVNVVILSFDVRKIGTTTVLDTWQVTLEAALSA
jgi:hypothetical protein